MPSVFNIFEFSSSYFNVKSFNNMMSDWKKSKTTEQKCHSHNNLSCCKINQVNIFSILVCRHTMPMVWILHFLNVLANAIFNRFALKLDVLFLLVLIIQIVMFPCKPSLKLKIEHPFCTVFFQAWLQEHLSNLSI